MSLLNPDDDSPGTGLASTLFGGGGSGAAAAASQQQTKFSRQALDILRGNLAPYVGAGEDAMLSALQLTTEGGRAGFLANNPIFGSMADNLSRDIFASQAARGKLESGGTAEQQQTALVQLGNDLIDQQMNRLVPLIEMGQASAARRGAGSVDLLTGIGNAQAAGQIAAANAQAQGTQNLITTAGTIAGAVSNQQPTE